MTDFANVHAYPPLYKRDTKGKVRMWRMEVGSNDDGSAGHRTVAGLEDGEKVTSGWKVVRGKNTGKANATTDVEQAHAEVVAKYTKQRDRGHFDSVSDIDSFEMFKPMLADDYAKRGVDFTGVDVYAQPKLDGMRCLARSDALWSRGFKEIVSAPHIYEALARIRERFPDLILDGELYNHELKHDFEKLMSLCRKTKPTEEDLAESAEKIEYHVYDLYNPNRPDMSFWERYELLRMLTVDLVMHNIRCIVPVHTVRITQQLDLDSHNDWMLDEGYEGQMIRYDLPYENKRSKTLLKRKPWQDAEFPVTAMLEGTGNWAGAAKNFEIVLPSGERMTPAVKGSHEVLAALLESGRTPDWAKVEFADYTADGSLRFPRVIDYGYGVRDD